MAPVISLVVSTIGRDPQLDRLLDSLANCPDPSLVELVVVDQTPTGRIRAMLTERNPAGLTIRTGTSSVGAAHGRNVGITLATQDLIAFPDDDSWYLPGTLPRVLELFEAGPELGMICGRQATADGRDSMLRWRTRPGPVTRRNFMHTSIASTMFVRRSVLDRVGVFDETIGAGSPGWFGAGEESDLVLRVLDASYPVWYDPSVVVGQDDPRDPDRLTDEFIAKMLRYGAGHGHLWRRYRLSRSQLVLMSLRTAAGAVVFLATGRRTRAKAQLAFLRGTLAGWTGRPPRGVEATGPVRPTSK